MNITGRTPHLFENIGAFIISCGAVVLLLDGGKAKTGDGSNVLLGDLMALCAAPFAFMYFSLMKQLQQHLTPMQSMVA